MSLYARRWDSSTSRFTIATWSRASTSPSWTATARCSEPSGCWSSTLRPFNSDREGTLWRIFRFLGVDEDFVDSHFSVEFNRSRAEAASVSRLCPLAPLTAGICPATTAYPIARSVTDRLMRTLTSPAYRAPFDDDLRLALDDVFRPEAERLRVLRRALRFPDLVGLSRASMASTAPGAYATESVDLAGRFGVTDVPAWSG